MKKMVIKWLLGGTLFYALFLFCHKETDGFQITKIRSSLPSFPQWQLPSLTIGEKIELETVFSQPFHYLDKGGQCFVFLSEDGKMVLKLFKMQNLRQYSWAYRFSLPGGLDAYRLEALQLQKEKLQRVFTSSYLAYTKLKEETGLIHLNLNPNSELNPLYVTLVDKLGIHHSLSLATIPFALQKRADRASRSLKLYLEKGELQLAKETVESTIARLKKRLAKGIIDVDPSFKRNVGLLEGEAIFIDIGGFLSIDRPLTQEDLIEETRTLRRFLKKRSPELVSFMDSLLALPEI